MGEVPESKLNNWIIAELKNKDMIIKHLLLYVVENLKLRKEYIVSRIEAMQDGSPYVYISLTDLAGGERQQQRPTNQFGTNAFPFTSPEDLMKNLPKAMAGIMGGGMGSLDSPTLKLSMREYEDMGLKVGDKVLVDIGKQENSGV